MCAFFFSPVPLNVSVGVALDTGAAPAPASGALPGDVVDVASYDSSVVDNPHTKK
jgi:hypothetical protein